MYECPECQKCGKTYPEIIMHFNAYDKKFYIYAGEMYLNDIKYKDVEKAIAEYLDYCTIILKELEKTNA